MIILLIGISAGILTTVAFFPQAARIIRTKHTKDLSLVTFLIFTVGVFLWLIYGLLLKEIPIIVANAITLVVALFIVAMKLKHG